jgi:cytochrome c oxidase assembly protein subunit 15
LQGLLGGLRVTLIKNEIGIFHGMLAQAFFVTVAVLAVATSPAFLRACERGDRWRANGLQWLAVAFTALVFVQLGVAATMRHAHLGLAIPDFPLAYGQVIPATDAATMATINAERVAKDQMPTTVAQIWLQMKHRLIAFGILALALAMVVKASRMEGLPSGVRARTWLLLAMVLVQIGLGAWTIWSNKAADVATAHMALGALTLMVGGITSFRLLWLDRAARAYEMEFPKYAERTNLAAAR